MTKIYTCLNQLYATLTRVYALYELFGVHGTEMMH